MKTSICCAAKATFLSAMKTPSWCAAEPSMSLRKSLPSHILDLKKKSFNYQRSRSWRGVRPRHFRPHLLLLQEPQPQLMLPHVPLSQAAATSQFSDLPRPPPTAQPGLSFNPLAYSQCQAIS
ncbi:unnamed protein product [Arctogadus glacialis]